MFVAATGRSASTLLDRIIGQLPGFVSTGEMNDIVRAGIVENRSCGCGLAFRDCPFWQSVGMSAFGGWDGVDGQELAAAARTSYGATLTGIGRGLRRKARTGDELLRRLYESVSLNAGGATVVDSSKSPNYAALLSGIPEFDVRIAHLVRDSRGVAYSWAKRVRRPDVPGRDVEMLRLNAWQVSGRWVVHNGIIELLSRRLGSGRVRYEDLVASPRAETAKLLHAMELDVPAEAFDFINGQTIRLAPNHTVMGNPMRMTTGEIEVRADEEWRAKYPAASRRLVTALTLPFLLRYGYPLTSRGAQRQPAGQSEARSS